ncbi:hypothetical protein ACMZ8B_03720 [Gardnerella greenwoodii]|uniref:hypothetical protein n=1 Tax=Gardnerella greenwoodii TaxID=2914925 RepID=UPI0039EF5ADC
MVKNMIIIADIVIAAIVSSIILLTVHEYSLTFWLSFICLVASILSVLIPLFINPPTDIMTRVPVYMVLTVNVVVQVILTLISNFTTWKFLSILELICLLVVVSIAFSVCLHEVQNDSAKAKIVENFDQRYTPKYGSF